MKKRILTILLVAIMTMVCTTNVFASSNDPIAAADMLHELELFNGIGTDTDGTPMYALERTPTRQEAVTMLVRLLGKEKEATDSNWEIPFTDVSEWARPYVGYAYNNGLTNGTSNTKFSGNQGITATEYITFVLRALGYESGKDFEWNEAWKKSDSLGFTDGQYSNKTNFTRGDVAVISNNAMLIKGKDKDITMLDSLVDSKAITREMADKYLNQPVKAEKITLSEYSCRIKAGGTKSIFATVLPDNAENKSIVWKSHDTKVATVKDGIITGISAGKTAVTAKTSNGRIIACYVTVYEAIPLDINLISAKLVIPSVGTNNSCFNLLITNNTGTTVVLNDIIYGNGKLCYNHGLNNKSVSFPIDVELENGKSYDIFASRNYSLDYGLMGMRKDMYLDNNSKAKFVIEYDGVNYNGECDIYGNTTFSK